MPIRLCAALVVLLPLAGLQQLAARAEPFPAVSTIAGSGRFGIPGGSTSDSPFMEPFGVAAAADGTIYVSDFAAERIVRIDPAHRTVRVVAGGGEIDENSGRVPGGFANGAALSARFNGPAGLAFDGGALLIADSRNDCVRRLENGVVTTFAGSCGHAADVNGGAAVARFGLPFGLAVVGADVYVADEGTGVRKIDREGNVSKVDVPSIEAYGLAYDPHAGELFAATSDGIFVVRNGAVERDVRYGDARGSLPASHLDFGYPVGNPFGIVALDDRTLLYSDAQTGALRYLETYTASGEVLSGAGAGGDFRATGHADGPLGRTSFVQPLGLALEPDRSVVVADGMGRVVRRIAPWTEQRLQVPASSTIPSWQAKRYRIAFVGNSTIWTGTTWYDSIQARLETQLDTPAFRASHGEPEVAPFWIVGKDQLAAAADYGAFLIQNRVADAVVVQQSSLSFFDPSPNCKGLDFAELWVPGEAAMLRLGEAARQAHIPVVGVAAPAPFDISPAEQIAWSISVNQVLPCTAQVPADSQRFHPMLLDLYARAHIAPVDLWPAFAAAEERPDSRPLFGSFDAHFTAEGRRLTADTILPALLRAIDAH